MISMKTQVALLFTKLIQLFLLLVLCSFLDGCSGMQTRPVYSPAPDREYPEPQIPDTRVPPAPRGKNWFGGPAAPMYKKAKTALGNKEYRQAELAMERALRVEPKNAYYWYTFAEIAYAREQCGRAVQLSLKSKSLAGKDTGLVQRSNALISKCK